MNSGFFAVVLSGVLLSCIEGVCHPNFWVVDDSFNAEFEIRIGNDGTMNSSHKVFWLRVMVIINAMLGHASRQPRLVINAPRKVIHELLNYWFSRINQPVPFPVRYRSGAYWTRRIGWDHLSPHCRR